MTTRRRDACSGAKETATTPAPTQPQPWCARGAQQGADPADRDGVQQRHAGREEHVGGAAADHEADVVEPSLHQRDADEQWDGQDDGGEHPRPDEVGGDEGEERERQRERGGEPEDLLAHQGVTPSPAVHQSGDGHASPTAATASESNGDQVGDVLECGGEPRRAVEVGQPRVDQGCGAMKVPTVKPTRATAIARPGHRRPGHGARPSGNQ